MSYDQKTDQTTPESDSSVATDAMSGIRSALRQTTGFDNQMALLAAIPGASLVNAARDWWNGGGKDDTSSTDTSDAPPEVVEAVVQATATQTPDEAVVEETPEEAAPETSDPLKGALDKVGKVDYKDKRFRKGGEDLTKAEIGKLQSGDADIAAANCSTFATWMLAQAGLDVMSRAENGGRRLNDYINICVPLETGSLSGDVEGSKDPIKGAAAGFVVHGLGYEVSDNSAIAPGDFIQTWSSRPGGHSQMVHRAHCTGAAIFGQPGSPTPIGFEAPAGGGAMGVGAPVQFKIDENTDPKLVGAHTVTKVEMLGCHLAGTDSEGAKNDPGVYTKAAHGLGNYHRLFAGRLNSSAWSNFTPADVAGFTPEAAAPEKAAPDETGEVEAPASPEPGMLDALYEGVSAGASKVSEWLFGGGDEQVERVDPQTNPAQVAPEVAEKPFEAPNVHGCDYVVHPDGTIVFWRNGTATREFTTDHQLYQRLHDEISAEYPELTYG